MWIVGVMCTFVLIIRVLFVPKTLFHPENEALETPMERELKIRPTSCRIPFDVQRDHAKNPSSTNILILFGNCV